MSRVDWKAIARTLAARLVYAAEACEHEGLGDEACCNDWRAYQQFVDAGGYDFRLFFRDTSGGPVSIFEVSARGDQSFSSESHGSDEVTP